LGVRWSWDPRKNRKNRRVHGLSFETASLVFDDRLALSRPDETAEEERWQTIGEADGVIILVVHTWPEPDESGEEVGRIISARKATTRERRVYEEGQF
jgi:hypothetical protein